MKRNLSMYFSWLSFRLKSNDSRSFFWWLSTCDHYGNPTSNGCYRSVNGLGGSKWQRQYTVDILMTWFLNIVNEKNLKYWFDSFPWRVFWHYPCLFRIHRSSRSSESPKWLHSQIPYEEIICSFNAEMFYLTSVAVK